MVAAIYKSKEIELDEQMRTILLLNLSTDPKTAPIIGCNTVPGKYITIEGYLHR
jgi:hypothetical protein